MNFFTGHANGTHSYQRTNNNKQLIRRVVLARQWPLSVNTCIYIYKHTRAQRSITRGVDSAVYSASLSVRFTRPIQIPIFITDHLARFTSKYKAHTNLERLVNTSYPPRPCSEWPPEVPSSTHIGRSNEAICSGVREISAARREQHFVRRRFSDVERRLSEKKRNRGAPVYNRRTHLIKTRTMK